MKKKTGWINVRISQETEQVFVSQHPYKTKREAQTGFIHSIGILKVGCFKITYLVPNGK